MGVIVEQLAIKARWWDAPSRSRILAEATSALIKKFSIVFFPNLHYTFITYNGRKSNEQRTKSNKQRAKSNEQRGKSNEQRAKTSEQRVKANEQRAKSFTSHFGRNITYKYLLNQNSIKLNAASDGLFKREFYGDTIFYWEDTLKRLC